MDIQVVVDIPVEDTPAADILEVDIRVTPIIQAIRDILITRDIPVILTIQDTLATPDIRDIPATLVIPAIVMIRIPLTAVTTHGVTGGIRGSLARFTIGTGKCSTRSPAPRKTPRVNSSRSPKTVIWDRCIAIVWNTSKMPRSTGATKKPAETNPAVS